MRMIKNKQMIYELFMILLATLSVATIWNQTEFNSYIIWITWAIFFTDFTYRLYKSEDKWKFIKSNPFLVVAIIPLDAVFQLARFARVLHLLRLKTITKYYTMPFIHFLKRQNILVVFSIIFLILFIAIIPLNKMEPEITSYQDAFVQSLMTLLFFGRTDFEPITIPGHVVLVLLTIIGVVFHGIIISTAADLVYHSKLFQSIKQRLKRKNKTKHDQE